MPSSGLGMTAGETASFPPRAGFEGKRPSEVAEYKVRSPPHTRFTVGPPR